MAITWKHHIVYVTNTPLLNKEQFLASHPNCDLALCLWTQIDLKWVSITEKNTCCCETIQNNPAETMLSLGKAWLLCCGSGVFKHHAWIEDINNQNCSAIDIQDAHHNADSSFRLVSPECTSKVMKAEWEETGLRFCCPNISPVWKDVVALPVLSQLFDRAVTCTM